jgi:acyl phosphate:glycerol-3-phosphate acyltransferase
MKIVVIFNIEKSPNQMNSISIFLIAVCSIVAYLLGSIPTSVWYGQAYFGIDLRQHGSGNAGATNTFRVLGKRAGIIVMLIDIIKGWTATTLVLIPLYFGLIENEETIIALKLGFGFLAVLGHIFPVYEHFKGGKGVATLLGMVFALHPEAAGLCILVFLSIVLLFHYVSLGSLLAALAFPVSMLLQVFGKEQTILIVFGFVMFGIVVWAHLKNIGRLLKGQESRMYLIKKK